MRIWIGTQEEWESAVSPWDYEVWVVDGFVRELLMTNQIGIRMPEYTDGALVVWHERPQCPEFTFFEASVRMYPAGTLGVTDNREGRR